MPDRQIDQRQSQDDGKELYVTKTVSTTKTNGIGKQGDEQQDDTSRNSDTPEQTPSLHAPIIRHLMEIRDGFADSG